MLNKINTMLWLAATLLIFITGIYFSYKIKCQQFNLKQMWKQLKKSGMEDGISPIQTLTLNLAARIGVGSISGIALAIYVGGPGTVFWMWVTAIIASANTFLESYFAVKYQECDEGNVMKGGPSYYIEKGLNKKGLAKLYSIIILITFICGFLTIQSNTIAIGLADLFPVPTYITGIILASITALIIMKGVKRIAKVTNFLVPLMGIIYFAICFIIILKNINLMPSIFQNIFAQAFNLKSAGIGIFTVFIIGMQRGIFSNEAGIGTGAITAATIKTKNYKSQGYIQTLGIYIDTLVVGTLSSIVVMCCNYNSLIIIDPNGIEIAKYAFFFHFGSLGNYLMMLIIILFALATIITGYYYGESAFKYIKKNYNKRDIILLKILALAMIIFGSIASSTKLWELNDVFIAILAIINTYALWHLKDKI